MAIPEIRKTVEIETEVVVEFDLSDFEGADEEDDFDYEDYEYDIKVEAIISKSLGIDEIVSP